MEERKRKQRVGKTEENEQEVKEKEKEMRKMDKNKKKEMEKGKGNKGGTYRDKLKFNEKQGTQKNYNLLRPRFTPSTDLSRHRELSRFWY